MHFLKLLWDETLSGNKKKNGWLIIKLYKVQWQLKVDRMSTLGDVQINLYTAKTPNHQFNRALNFSTPKLTFYFQGEMKRFTKENLTLYLEFWDKEWQDGRRDYL